MAESKDAYRLLVGKLEVKRPLGRLRLRWGDNITMDLKKDDGGRGLDRSGSG
jgi:hypothetical protein